MRSWITQLLPRAQQAFDLIRDKWEATDGRTASKIDIKELFDTLIHNLPPCTFVVDGLDECAVADMAGGLDHQSSLFEFLRSLACTISQSKSRLLIVSRNEVRIREGLSVENDQTKREFVELPISPNDVKADASAFSASIVNRKLSNKSNMQREELASRLVDRCQSMFLAIKLLEDDLRGGKNLKQLQRAIDQAPQKLDNIYDRNWDRIQRLENSTRSRAFSILRWATFAVRPLTILELTECLLLTGECDEIDYEELPDTVDDIYVKTEILEICGSLIEIRGEPSSILGHSTVHLAHFSVREYILYRMPFYGVDPIANEQLRSSSVGIQNNTLAMLCLHYLNCDQTWKEVELGQPGGTIIHAFRRYAANWWHLHVRREAANSGQTFQTINAFFRPPNPNWEKWRMECVDIFPEDWLSHNEREIEVGNRLFYASLLGLAETVEYLIEEVRLEIDNVDSSARTALIAASITARLPLCPNEEGELRTSSSARKKDSAITLGDSRSYIEHDVHLKGTRTLVSRVPVLFPEQGPD